MSLSSILSGKMLVETLIFHIEALPDARTKITQHKMSDFHILTNDSKSVAALVIFLALNFLSRIFHFFESVLELNFIE